MLYSTSFTYNGKSCEDFDLLLCTEDKNIIRKDKSIGGVNYVTDKTNVMTKHYFLDSEYDDVFEFELTMMSKNEKDRVWVGEVLHWLTGYHDYKKLTFDQPDMKNIYFNCLVSEVDIITVGNVPRGFVCKFQCDRGYAIEDEEKVYSITNGNSTFKHMNTSHTHGITLPIIEITMASYGDVSIINKNNNNLETKLTSLTGGEVITMDSQHEILTSSLDLRRLSNFNKVWFELVEGENNITVNGNVSKILIKYENNRKVGI